MNLSKIQLKKHLQKIQKNFSKNYAETFDFERLTSDSYKTKKIYDQSFIGFMRKKQGVKGSNSLILLIESELNKISKYPELVQKLAFINIVSHFEVFFQEITWLVLRINWKAFSNSDQKSLTYKKIFQFDSPKSLLDNIISKEVQDLTYKKKRDHIEELENKYNFSTLEFVGYDNSEKEKEKRLLQLEEIFETRNIILHNSNYINEKYLKIITNTDYKIGDQRKIDHEYFIESSTFMAILGGHILNCFDEKYLK